MADDNRKSTERQRSAGVARSGSPANHGPTNSIKLHLGSDPDKQIIVIKVGTSSLVRAEQQTLNLGIIARLCETVKTLRSQGHHVIIVSSGAVGVGCQRLGLATKPGELAKKQALAAVGQLHLMRYYEDFMAALNLRCAQVLLTLDNLANRAQYLNARNTFTELLAYGVVPIVNENDTVAVQELRFGDNDTLSAQVATLVQADWLFLMTDVDCLYTANPKDDPAAQPIYEVHDMGALRADTSTRGTQWGTGGMATKLTAGRIATAAGCTMVICSSTNPEVVARVLGGEQRLGTKFFPVAHALRGRYRWILSVPVRGQLWLDAGAVKAVSSKVKRASLFAAGITKVEGRFNPQDAVSLCDEAGVEFARGLVNFSADEVRELRRMAKEKKQAVDKALGFNVQEEVVHRSFLSLLVGQAGDADETEDDPEHAPVAAPGAEAGAAADALARAALS
uniref:PUA domain-containing protein n=1 Tax=Chlamydomonas leiostraca TaxID=1034604 RepID=A0A7S0RM90_9CHLO|mmetsp:Transcript_26167/g.66615  ORF Transcript_26167/g.66615 Transcript_26167/m.66615 type:complete len:451 (+) Transcript_26167:73-1425(+)